MKTTVCTTCRLAMRQRLATPSSRRAFKSSTTKAADLSPREILSSPTWSVRSLLPTASSSASSAPQLQEEEITPATLRHLLRLSALPPPASPEEESQLLGTLRSQLHFVRNIQSVDTTGVRPLVSIRDETTEGIREQTIGLDTLQKALGSEDVIGHSKRPRRRRQDGKKEQIKGIEDWDVLKGAGEKAGRYFVVRSGPSN